MLRIAAPLTLALVPAALVAAWPAGPAAGRPTDASPWRFTEVSLPAGVSYAHGLSRPGHEPARMSGGVAAGDYDRDGWVDLYAVRGDVGANLLLRNRGDGTFLETAEAAGVAIGGSVGSGPTFADADGDGWLDLLVGGVEGTAIRLFRNRRDGTFEETTARSRLSSTTDTYSAAFGDYDQDGDLDLALAHWFTGPDRTGQLWRNERDGVFLDVTSDAGLNTVVINGFTPNFADIDSDGWPDLLVAADYGTSHVLRNLGDGRFADVTSPVISDENGMGAAIGDYDNDGDLDWFVSSIFDTDGHAEGNWGVTGNRLYRNRGDGTFEDATDAAGVRHGFWGWGSCFADFNNDGHLDLFHVNGFFLPLGGEFTNDTARLFVANGDGSFSEGAADLGVADTGAGRGVVCFDYDRDGDVDIFIANNRDTSRLYRNDGGNRRSFLGVRLLGPPGNTEGIGARISLTAGGLTQMRELRAGSNFESQDPAEAHFGLGEAWVVEVIRVVWPDGAVSEARGRPGGRIWTFAHPRALPGRGVVPPPAPGPPVRPASLP